MLLTGTGMGVVAWMRLQRRVNALRQISDLLGHLAERIRYTAAPMEELMGDLLCKIGIPDTAKTDPRDPEVRENWKAAIDAYGAQWGLYEDDRVLLKGFAEGIGRADVTGEIRFCGEYRAAVDSQLSDAREAAKTKGRVQLTLGICGGLLAALLLW